MIGTFSVLALTVNILVGAAVAVAVLKVAAWRARRAPKLFVGEPKQGGQGRWWMGVFDSAGKRIWQTAPPGHSSRGGALRAADQLRHSRIGRRSGQR